MATADLTRLMDTLRTRLPGAVDNAMRLELFGALDEFFQKSSSWKEDIEVRVRPDVFVYDLESDEYTAKVVRVEHAQNADEVPVKVVMPEPGVLRLLYGPAQIETITVKTVLTVSDPVTTEGYPRIPAWVLEKYREYLLDGVVGRMMSQHAKPYSNERLAIYHLRRFRSGMSQAKVDAHHQHLQGAQRWQFPKGFA